MGLIKEAKDVLVGLLEEQWRDYFNCESLPSDVLVMKGEKCERKGKKSTVKENDNIIFHRENEMIVKNAER